MLLEKVAGAKWLSQFYLAGGTSLALQLGHRLSIDFDFFTDKTFSTQKIIQHLSKVGKVSIQDESTGTLNLFLDQIKLSFLLILTRLFILLMISIRLSLQALMILPQ